MLVRVVSVTKICATAIAPLSPICRKLRSKSVTPTNKLIMFSKNRSRRQYDSIRNLMPQNIIDQENLSLRFGGATSSIVFADNFVSRPSEIYFFQMSKTLV